MGALSCLEKAVHLTPHDARTGGGAELLVVLGFVYEESFEMCWKKWQNPGCPTLDIGLGAEGETCGSNYVAWDVGQAQTGH